VPPLIRHSLLLIAVFAVVTAIASAAGAVNLGTAMTFGQVAFAVVLVGLMLLGGRHSHHADEHSGADAPAE
jgi:uncharacterized membrane protein YfbV (UPF0208 family)